MTGNMTELERALWLLEQDVANAVTLGATADQVDAAKARGLEQGATLARTLADGAKWRNQAA